MANTTFVSGGNPVHNFKFQKGDHVVVVNDGSATGAKKPGLTNGSQHMITDVRNDGMVEIDGSAGYYFVDRFVLDPAYAQAMPTGGQVKIPAGPLAKALMGGGNYGAAIGSQQAQPADPGKPFPDPEAEREKTAEEKLREYRKSVRQMIGL